MAIIYEINPPKIPDDISNDEKLNSSLIKLRERVSEISSLCDGIHITDSVLGTKRVSALVASKLIKSDHPKLGITVSMRVRDKSVEELEQYVNDAISIGVDGILVLMGDPSKNNSKESGLIPSQIVANFNKKFSKSMKFFLSLPSKPDFKKIQKKVNAKPEGFMTQVIHSVEQVKRISNELKPKGFRIVPCVLLPSEKNSGSAQFLNLDWSGYKEHPERFIKEIHDVTNDVLITSPSDFAFAIQVLKKL